MTPHARQPGTSKRDPVAAAAVQGFLKGLGPGSQRTARQSLDVIAALASGNPKMDAEGFKWAGLTADQTLRIQQLLAEKYAPATANKMLSFLRGVLRACRDLKQMPDAKCSAATKVPNIPATWHPTDVPPLTITDVRQLFNACAADPSVGARRDAALLAVFLISGLRRAEAAALSIADLDDDLQTLRIQSPDPAKCREVQITSAARAYLRDWLEVRDDDAPGGPLLLPVNKSGRVQDRQLTDQAIYTMIRRIGINAGLPAVTSRSLRLTYVINLIAKGLPVERVQALVGHASWVTTEAYLDLAKCAAAEGFKPFNLPYIQPYATPPTGRATKSKGGPAT